MGEQTSLIGSLTYQTIYIVYTFRLHTWRGVCVKQDINKYTSLIPYASTYSDTRYNREKQHTHDDLESLWVE